MDTYRNTSEHRRVWPNVRRPDGSTLELEPGEECALDLAAAVPHLQRVGRPRPAARAVSRRQRRPQPQQSPPPPVPSEPPPSGEDEPEAVKE
jgi:hypothetical protein